MQKRQPFGVNNLSVGTTHADGIVQIGFLLTLVWRLAILVLLFALVAMISAALIRQRRYLHYGVHTVVPTPVLLFGFVV